MEPPREGRTKVYITDPCHMTKMATMLIYGKNLLQNQKSYDNEIWHVASGAQALQNLNDDPGVDLDLFYGKVN